MTPRPACPWPLEVRDGAVWGNVEWTTKAAARIQAKECRFLSPVFTYQKSDTCIIELTSVGLTNQPNLNLAALNRVEDQSAMSLLNALRRHWIYRAFPTKTRLLLKTAKNWAKTLPLDKLILRVDYDAALSRTVNVEQNLAKIEKSGKTQAINALIEKALQVRQISPATKDFYVAVCQREGDIKQFTAFFRENPRTGGSRVRTGRPQAARNPVRVEYHRLLDFDV